MWHSPKLCGPPLPDPAVGDEVVLQVKTRDGPLYDQGTAKVVKVGRKYVQLRAFRVPSGELAGGVDTFWRCCHRHTDQHGMMRFALGR